jgi:maleylpyruvate isomerase
MKLYSYWRSSCAWRVRIVLNSKGLEYDYAAVNIAPDVNQQASATYAQVNPMQQVPALEWQEGGKTHRLTQSNAIVEYLEQRYPDPPLLPSDALQRARVRELMEIVNSGIQPLQNTSIQARIRALGGQDAVQGFLDNVIGKGLRAFSSHVKQNPGRYAFGDTPTLADAYLVPQLYAARRFGMNVAEYPRLLEIEAALSELPAFAGARPERQPDAAQE